MAIRDYKMKFPTMSIFIFLVSITGCKDKITSPSIDGNYLLCYTKSYNGYGEIFINNIMGTDPQDISNYPNNNDYPQWLPDGRFIVYSRSISIGGPLVIVYNIKNKTETNLTSDGGGASLTPQWTPNGKVYFAYQRPIGSTTTAYLINPDGSDKKRIWTLPSYFYQDSFTFLIVDGTNNVYKTNIDSTINEFVYYLGNLNQYTAIQGFNPFTEELLLSLKIDDSTNAIATYNLNSKKVNILLANEKGYAFGQLKYSRDYTKIAFIEIETASGKYNEEYLSILENGEKRRLVKLTGDEWFDYNPIQFSYDGRYIAYSKNIYQSGQWISWNSYLYVVDASSGTLQYIDEGVCASWNPKP
jgi:Tol biopolymer transport system component